ncbi:MAG: hypothetical protein LBU65_05655 [Planctomycetaceae bacterium]|jgi:hypothetical protein|nr:hypothetical protein [Planctomycetaceae bacterium]
MRKIIKYFTLFVAALLFLTSLNSFAVSLHEEEMLMQQPKNHKEFLSLLQSSIESQPFVYTISSLDRTFLDNKDWNLNRQEISVRQCDISTSYICGLYANEKKNVCCLNIIPSVCATKDFFTRTLTVAPLPLGPNDAVAMLNHRYAALPTNFFHSRYNNEPIGNFSYERKFGIWADDPTNAVFFLRGNCFIQVNTQIYFVYDSETEPGGRRKIKLSQGPDPREVAWKIDQYLKGDPLAKLGNEAKQKIRTLKITLPKDTKFEIGKEYPLDFPRKSPDGAIPAEIRLVVSRGEIQQVIETNTAESAKTPNPASLAPEIDGKYTVLFGQPEKQTIHCYHINEEGKCLAWGEIEVSVKKSEK